MDGEAVAIVEGTNVYFIRTDHISRPVFATDDTGTKVWEASYLPFGGIKTSTRANTKRPRHFEVGRPGCRYHLLTNVRHPPELTDRRIVRQI